MRRISFTIPDELDRKLQAHLKEKDSPPNFSALVRIALSEFLRNEHLRERGYSIHELQGILPPPDKVLTLEQMDEIIASAGELNEDDS